MAHQVKGNFITTFETCCINNTIGICRAAKSISKSTTSKTKTKRDSSVTHGPNLGEDTRQKNQRGVTDISENWILVFFGLHRLERRASCSWDVSTARVSLESDRPKAISSPSTPAGASAFSLFLFLLFFFFFFYTRRFFSKPKGRE